MSHIDDASTLPVSWRKSSYSGAQSDCVEVGTVGERVAVRDSKNPTGPALLLTHEQVAGLVSAARGGLLDA
jgi:hypothetical protein